MIFAAAVALGTIVVMPIVAREGRAGNWHEGKKDLENIVYYRNTVIYHRFPTIVFTIATVSRYWKVYYKEVYFSAFFKNLFG